MNRRSYEDYVPYVIRFGSLTKAAAELGISQPALSSGINSLEKELGFRIFDRQHSPVKLTPEGEIYQQYLLRMKELSKDFSKRLLSLKDSRKHCVSIGGPIVYVESLITEAAVRLHREHPDFSINIKSASLPELLELASKGELNCFVSTSENIPEHLTKKKIKDEQICLYIPKAFEINQRLKSYELRRAKPGTFMDYACLNGQNFIFLEQDQPLQKKIMNFMKAEEINPNFCFTADQVSVAMGLTLRGEGICFAPADALKTCLNPDLVCVYALPKSMSSRKIYIAYDPELYQSPACTRFIEIITHDEERNVQP